MSSLTTINFRSAIEQRLDSPAHNDLKEELCRRVVRANPQPIGDGDIYDLFVVRRAPDGDNEPFKVGSYPAGVLYGAAATPIFRFRQQCKVLAKSAASLAAKTDAGELEYGATLFWSDIALLHEFFGVSQEVNRLVAALRLARAHFFAKPTPALVIRAIGSCLADIGNAITLTDELADSVVERMEAAGIDPNLPLASLPSDG